MVTTKLKSRGAKNRAIEVLVLSDMLAVRFCLSVAAILWAVMLFWPGETFDRPTYFVMRQFAPEPVWATLFLAQGVVMIAYLLYDCTNRVVLCVDSVLGCGLWTCCTIAMIISVFPPPAAISAEIAMALASWWNLVRLS